MQWAIPALSSVEVLVLGESGPRSEYGEWRMQNTVGVMYLESDLAIMEEISKWRWKRQRQIAPTSSLDRRNQG